MSTALARLAVRTTLLAVILATLMPIVGVAQESPGFDNELAAPSDAQPASSVPQPAPAAAPAPPAVTQYPTPSPKPLPSHDWRSVGFASVVDGKLYDPFCRPMRSVGSNVPNLMFRDGLRENLEWMRQRQMRWLRVIATGHGTLRPGEQAVPGVVEQRL